MFDCYSCNACGSHYEPAPCTHDILIPDSLYAFCSTNDPPPLSEIPHLMDLQQTVHAAQEELEFEIRRIMLKLNEKRRTLQWLSNDLKSVLSPIRRLPPEILMEIFLHTNCLRVTDTTSDPWILSHVCSTWRTIATVHCPELWSDITITPSSFRRKDPFSLVQTALHRSGQHDLFIQFRDGGKQKSKRKAVATVLFSLLALESNRWKTAQLSLSSERFGTLSTIRGRLSRLSQVNLTYAGDETPPLHIDAFEMTPRLESISIEGFQDNDIDTLIPLSSPKLRQFRDDRELGDNALNARLLATIRHSPALQSFHVYHRNRFDPRSTLPVTPRIENASLHTLQASEGALLRSLRLPALKTLWLGTDENNCMLPCPDDVVPSLHVLISVSQCSLTSLILTQVSISNTPDFIHLLQLMPRLEVLEMSFIFWRDEYDSTMRCVVEGMIECSPPARQALLPALTEFSIEVSDATDSQGVRFIDDVFVDMVASRCNSSRAYGGAPKLKYVRAEIRSPAPLPLSAAATNRLKELFHDGLEITILTM
ncbi:uncharacterized protein BT62DRAFT_546045 [Guyanagaster necrorhizus]|uniref:F-box domain-containing protein n=1 Tax=Guyanagaster necrorhizus TaxID=856835 RepID=A0A9P8ANV3_9AGAR|nr:uncharacterized protein BT62DRAFT_546045 [Guyanagaster necrorhizus MCA 3950]KAG7441232.1 hypothetical protein BT62DRAFT_546045 [Guyanagaster necrorhizus MCA 3950]